MILAIFSLVFVSVSFPENLPKESSSNVRINKWKSKSLLSYLGHAFCHLSTHLHICPHFSPTFYLLNHQAILESVNLKANHYFLTLTMLFAIFPFAFISVSIIPEKLTCETYNKKKKHTIINSYYKPYPFDLLFLIYPS